MGEALIARRGGSGSPEGQHAWEKYKLSNELPNGYVKLEYIQSNGEQYINTGHCPTQNTKVEATAEYLSDQNYPMLCGAYVSNSNQFAIFYNLGWNAWFGTKTAKFAGDYAGKKQFALDKSNFSVEGTSTAISSSNFTSTVPLYLFASNENGSISYKSTIKLYGFKLYENNVLIRDYVPALNAEGEVGLYDLINDTFYGNNGTGAFIAGQVVRDFMGYVLSNNENAYPNYGMQDGYWYEPCKSEGLNVWERQVKIVSYAESRSTYNNASNGTVYYANNTVYPQKTDVTIYYASSYTFDAATGEYKLVNPSTMTLKSTAYAGSCYLGKGYYSIVGSPTADKDNPMFFNGTGNLFFEWAEANGSYRIRVYSINAQNSYYAYRASDQSYFETIGFVVDDSLNAYPNGSYHTDGFHYELLGSVASTNVMSLSDGAIATVQEDYREQLEGEVSQS